MIDEDFDCLIDRAARELVSHEAPRSLRGAVMSRVREPQAAASRPFVWATAAVALVLCSAIAITISKRDETSPAHVRDAQAPTVQQSVQSEPSVLAKPIDDKPVRETRMVRGSARPPAPLTRTAGSSRTQLDLEMAAIPFLETEPIVMTVMEVSPLETETTAMTQIDIAPLTIEPLTVAAND